jgi:hypothetical protein
VGRNKLVCFSAHLNSVALLVNNRPGKILLICLLKSFYVTDSKGK